MDNQTPPIQNPPVENPIVQEVPPSAPKSFLSKKIILLVVILVIFLGAGGTYLVLNSKTKSSSVVSRAIPTSTPTPTPDITASWKTYKNGQIGITFSYPGDWTLVKTYKSDETGLTVTSYSSYLDLAPQDYNGVLINITLFENPKDLSIEEYEKKLEKETNIDWDLYKPSDKQLSTELEEDAFYRGDGFCEPSPCDIYTLIYHGKGKIVRLSSFKKSLSEGKIPNQKKVFDQILSTFKFTQ